ncbi:MULTISPECIES: hypothetical protein [unclassified Zunongwangia]|uniref:hypothetical protein n=1 Tax=unclassified Zunongwangia TaxID=2632541 RepID=UPI0022DD96C9|nr:MULTISPECIES: hypothetical protein [unclassified Zunongwangia]WBL22786.1 hypothetical protein PBT89_02215 [Zunongwangia sp. HRR-M8]WBL25301.1 hypothetical protein PBT91_15555 [Zunongwangia sp. HGR-M22]
MKEQVRSTGKWIAGYLAAKAGKKVVAKSGLIGLGFGAAAGGAYIGYKLLKKLKRQEDISHNNHEIKGEKKIVV